MATAAGKAEGRVLLPDAVLPSRYEIRLTPDLHSYVFAGEETITVTVREATDQVVLHAKELTITSVSFESTEGSTIEVTQISHNLKETTVTFTFSEVLPVGTGKLSIVFTGVLNNQMAGFYRSSYKDINGVSKTMASTQFESIDARRCFPCWDEPARKAVFGLTLVIEPYLTGFSNMPEKSCRHTTVAGKRLKELVFMDSPKMSTYLLAFVVGEFDFVQATTEHGVMVRVFAPPGRAEAGTFPLRIAVKCLDLYDDFFGLPYPLPKLDMVAIPEFAMGAMENWGLVTYREADLLIDERTASGQQRQRVAIVVAHELAHQWFGNLVTMAWWDDLWLNEGFASWCENYAVDIICPDFHIWDQFPSDTLAAALRLDSLKTSHPIQVPIKHAEEVEEVFDAISYCKGASVIRMAYAILGHDAFRLGLQEYMKKHQYSNTETFDLWEAWAASSKKPVKEIMSSWTEQMGFPLVEVTSYTVSGSTAKLGLRQTWFLSSGEATTEEKTWSTPIFLRTSKSAQPTVMMSGATLEIEVPVAGPDDFVLINDGVQAPIRVAYTAELRAKLLGAVRSGALSVADRAALVMDSYALAKAGKLGTDELLTLLTSYVEERDYTVWDALSTVLLGLQRLFMGGADEKVYEGYMAFAGLLVDHAWQATNLGWEARASDGFTDGLLRGLLMKLVSRFAASPGFLAEARRRFDKYLEDPKKNATELPDEYRVPVFQAVLKYGGETEFRKLLGIFKSLETSIEQKHVFLSIGFTPDSKLKLESLLWAISGEVKIQDFFYIMASVSTSSKAGLEQMWGFLRSEFSKIYGMVKTASPGIMDAVINYSVSGFCSLERVAEIEQFFQKNPLPLCRRSIEQAMEEITGSAKFLERALATNLVKAEFWDQLKTSAFSKK